MGTRAAWIVAALGVACTTPSTPGAERGAGWNDAGRNGPERDAGARAPDAAQPRTLIPNIEAVLKGECASATAPSRLLPANVLFALDRSSSMACNPPPTTTSSECEETPLRADADLPSKWEVTREALVHAIGLLPPETVVGLGYFSNDDACGVHSAPSVPLAALGLAQTSTIDASLTNVAPGGSTPLVGATVLAYRHLHEEARLGHITGRRFVVLITDGEQSDSCSDPRRCDGAEACTRLLVEEEVPKAAAVGIRTFVIGAPGSEPARDVLSGIAHAGGTAPADCKPSRGNCHFDMTLEPDFGGALRAALAEIAGRVVACEFAVPAFDGEVVDRGLINIVYTPGDGDRRVIVRDDRRACDEGADGWQFDQDGTQIRLCGPSCEDVRADPDAELDVVLGCPGVGPM